MILTQLRDYLKNHGQAPLQDMALTFQIDQEALKPMLEHWIKKGKVEKLPEGTACQGCSKCTPQSVEIYRWIG